MGPATGDRLSFNLATSLDELAPWESSWRRLTSTSPAGLAATWDWIHCWCRHYLKGRNLRVFLVPSELGLHGALPMIVDNLRIAGLSVRLGKLVGGDSVLDHCDPPFNGPVRDDVLSAALQNLFEEQGCDAVTLGPIPSDHPLVAAVLRFNSRSDQSATLWRSGAADVITRVDLPDTFEAFLGSLGRDERKAYRRRLGRFQEDQRGEVTVVTEPDQLAVEFPQFMELHARQWKSIGKLGHFGDWPGSGSYHMDLIRRLAPQGRAWLVCVSAAGRPVGYQYVLCSDTQVRAVLLARDVDEKFRPYSLGTLAFYAAVERAIVAGKRIMDVGRGRYEYKLRQGAHEVPLHSFVWVRNRGLSKLRFRALSAFSALLQKAYYRGWFGRIAPRLPLPRRPLWQLWIRTRI